MACETTTVGGRMGEGERGTDRERGSKGGGGGGGRGGDRSGHRVTYICTSMGLGRIRFSLDSTTVPRTGSCLGNILVLLHL